jgi:XTP/dITP diphosphohydrolase
MEGLSARERKGTGGFGYDALFYLPAYGKTSAEIPAEVKNRISHRYHALQNLIRQL